MAVKTFEEIYGSLSADQKKLIDNIFQEHQELKEGWLRQDDYSRNMNQFKAEKAKYDEALAYKEKMEPWAEAAYERINRLEKEGILDAEGNVVFGAEQKTRLERELEEARKGLGGDMDAAEVEKRVRAIVQEMKGAGLEMTKEELAATYRSEAEKVAKDVFANEWKERETKFNSETIPFVSGFATSLALAASKYEKESGKEFTEEDQKALYDLMGKEKNYNPRQVMDIYLKPHRDEKKLKDEVDRRVAEELAKRGMPGGGNETFIPSEQQHGAIREMLERSSKDGGSPDADFENSIRAAAAAAAKDLRAAGAV